MIMQGFFATLAAALLVVALPARAAGSAEIKIGYLRLPHVEETVSILDSPSPDDGIAGARLAIEDANTTGRFLGQSFSIEDCPVTQGSVPAAALDDLVRRGAAFIVADLPALSLLALADSAKDKGVLIFHIGAPEDSLRGENCRANVLHIAPSHSMLADGLAQYLVWKQWKRWLLMKGSHPQDELFAAAVERSAKKFGAKIVEERVYEDTGGGRRSDSGSVQTQRLIPVATQNAPAYDVLVAADESEVFASYLPFRTWDPRPVAGSAGLRPMSWDGSHEQWGALQLTHLLMN